MNFLFKLFVYSTLLGYLIDIVIKSLL